jgi:myo-inositol-1(or 4)-monophosphatase
MSLVEVPEEFLSVALQVAAAAGRRLRTAWAEPKTVEHKGEIDLVTATDREVEALVVDALQSAFPDHLLVGEEGASGRPLPRPRDDQYAWYIDPLDGTTNFAHSFPQFAVSIGLARGPELVLGVVHDPMRGETFAARRGHGATLNGEAIHVSATARLNAALVGTGFPYDRREHVDFYLGFVKDFILRTHGVRRLGSAALDLCALACGRLDGFWEWKLSPWDTAAAVVILREAGGVVSDFAGAPFDLYGIQTLASNGRIHAEMSEVLQARLAAH